MDKQIHPVDRLVGQRVRVLRLANGLSQTSLAQEIGVSFQQLQKYENGTNRISASKLYMIANALNVQVASLFEDAAEGTTGRPPTSAELRIIAKLSQLTDENLKGRVLDFISALAKSPPGKSGSSTGATS